MTARQAKKILRGRRTYHLGQVHHAHRNRAVQRRRAVSRQAAMERAGVEMETANLWSGSLVRVACPTFRACVGEVAMVLPGADGRAHYGVEIEGEPALCWFFANEVQRTLDTTTPGEA